MSSTLLEPALFRRVCALFPTGVAVLTTRAPNGAPHGLTINAFCSLSLHPPLVLTAIDRATATLEIFEKAGHFGVNFLSMEQQALSVRFSELPEGRFAGVSWSAGPLGSPRLDSALGWLECRTERIVDAGDHRAFIGEVVAAEAGGGAPLVYFRSGYTELR
jgi:4-hydroxyphenylacetate 3-hydroxylase, reductase component